MLRRPDVNLRLVSRWVWVLLALAAVWFVLSLVAAATITLDVIYAAFVGATPAVFAAALMFAAPRERLVRIAAIAFALPIAVNSVLGGGILLSARNTSNDWAYLVPRLSGAASAFTQIAWIFPIIAVVAIAMYIGPITSRGRWAIVVAAIVFALVQAANTFASAPEGVPLQTLATSALAQLIWVAWAYLLAVALARATIFIAIAATSHLASAAVGFVAFNLLSDQLTGDASSLPQQILLAVLWVLGLVGWSALIIGIVRELPRTEETTVSARRQEAFSTGR